MRIDALAMLALLSLPACGGGGAYIAAPATASAVTSDDTVWFYDARGAREGNQAHVTMCRRGERPVCVRFTPAAGTSR